MDYNAGPHWKIFVDIVAPPIPMAIPEPQPLTPWQASKRRTRLERWARKRFGLDVRLTRPEATIETETAGRKDA